MIVEQECACGPTIDGVAGCDYNGCTIWCTDCRPFFFDEEVPKDG